MPIRAELLHFYETPEWEEARSRTMERAGDACERCKVPNGAIAGRYERLPGLAYELGKRTVYMPDKPAHKIKTSQEQSLGLPDRLVRIVICVAHLDHDPSNNDDLNLKALCQYCHLLHDRLMHLANSRHTRQRKKDSRRPLFEYLEI